MVNPLKCKDLPDHEFEALRDEIYDTRPLVMETGPFTTFFMVTSGLTPTQNIREARWLMTDNQQDYLLFEIFPDGELVLLRSAGDELCDDVSQKQEPFAFAEGINEYDQIAPDGQKPPFTVFIPSMQRYLPIAFDTWVEADDMARILCTLKET